MPYLKTLGRQINRRLLEVERVSQKWFKRREHPSLSHPQSCLKNSAHWSNFLTQRTVSAVRAAP
jgi:hypothetical protein